MGKFLSAEQIGQFQRDGYVPALTAFSAHEAVLYRANNEEQEARHAAGEAVASAS